MSHLTEEEIDEYSLDRLRGPDLDRVEQHLLLCGDCMEQVERSDELNAALHDVFAVLVDNPFGGELELLGNDR